ncbi:hypothetical protein [Ruminococcus flavefaciens]|uniref:hypothetical protein n=1 Tax=Ruminococcus flavefaciens TaxID=1265 RepID=UPI0026E9DB13|nr:hypothetical protein [Ruminococcus flavefaciens]
MKSFKSFFKRCWIIIWVVVASLSFVTVGIVYAAFTKSNSEKIVLARVGKTGKLFSSNYLQNGISMSDTIFYVDADSTEMVDFVRISNYVQGSPGKTYPRAINYELEMKLVYLDGDEYKVFADNSLIAQRYIKVKINGGEDIYFGYNEDAGAYQNVAASYKKNMSLAGGSPTTDSLRIEYSPDQKLLLTSPDPAKPKMYLEIKATPTPASNYLDIDPLSGRLNLQLTGQVQSVVWSGYINETGARENVANTSPAVTLDDYNYVIEGTGKGTIHLIWDTTYLELNHDFISELSSTEGYSYSAGDLTFKVDSNSISRYDTQFYRTGEALTYYDDWNEVNGYITCTFTPDS